MSCCCECLISGSCFVNDFLKQLAADPFKLQAGSI